MSKIGVEVEGRLRGVPTFFIDAEELDASAVAKFINLGVSHIYISDRYNTLNYNEVGHAFEGYLVTLDVTAVKEVSRPTNVTLMLSMPHGYWDSVQRLRPDDQVKFHSEDRNVLCVSARNLVATQPIEFLADRELK